MAGKGKLKAVSYRKAMRASPVGSADVTSGLRVRVSKAGVTPALRFAGGTLTKIVSGGQTGVDRAALDFAIEHGIPHGGWCPQGRRAEDGEIASAYALRETPESHYPQRTEWNVRDSDGTVIFTIAPELIGGSALTRDLALQLHKPLLHLAQETDGRTALGRLRAFLCRHRIQVLNVAGPRLSTEPGARAFASQVLEALWSAR